MFCPDCGAPNDDDAVYCGNCGALVNPDAMPDIEGGETPWTVPLESVDLEASEAVQGAGEEEILAADESRVPATVAEPPTPPPPPVYLSTAVQTSGMAIASLVSGIAGWTLFPLVGSILAIVFGYAARREIRQRPEELTGDGLAVAGLVLGWLAVGLTVVGLCFVAVALCLASSFFGTAGG